MKLKRATFVLAVLAAVCLVGPAGADLKPGDAAPDFKVADSVGKEQGLSSYRGKYVVLEWFNAGCPFVRKHYGSGNMQALQKETAGKGVAWLSVISSAPGNQGHSTPADANATRKEWSVASTATLLDPEGRVGKLYGAKTTPHVFVVNPEGKIIYMGAIDDKPSTDAEDVKTAKNYVRTALDEAMAGKAVTTAATTPYGCSVKY